MAIFSVEDFPYLKPIQDAFPAMKYEFDKADEWLLWGSDSPDPTGRAMFAHGGDWKVSPLYFGEGRTLNDPNIPAEMEDAIRKMLAKKFPITTRVLSKIPEICYGALTKVPPHTKLGTHAHSRPMFLTFHMGYVIPPGDTCGLKVEDETFIWKNPGDTLIFDGDVEHSAWNNSDEDRIVFFAEFDRPADFDQMTPKTRVSTPT